MAQKHTLSADVIIVGGGLAGMTMTALLAAHDIGVICLDQEDPAHLVKADYDLRTMAISYGAQKVIAAAGAWDEKALTPCPIRSIRVLHDGSPALLNLLSEDVQADAFGWIVDSCALRASLLKRVHKLSTAQHLAPVRIDTFAVDDQAARVYLKDGRQLSAPLVIGADGKHSFTREWMNIPVRRWSYHQQAVIAIIHHEKSHQHTAIEHFRPEGPFALLPVTDSAHGGHRSALVWVESTRGRTSRMDWDEATFRAAVQSLLPEEYGAILHIEPRAAYPLTFSHAYRYAGPRMALIADAAHAIHPVAGQGLNLGLRDIAVLSELIVQAKDHGIDPGNADVLATYERERRFDNTLMAAATDALDKLFANDSRIIGALRTAGLQAIRRLPKAQKILMREAMGAPHRAMPKLMRDGHLR